MRALANFFGVSQARLFYHLYRHPNKYRTFQVPKRNGTPRLIEAPTAPLVLFQRTLADCLQAARLEKASAHGFARRRSVVTNAKRHLGAQLILNIDLKDFFHSIHFGRVRGAFMSHPLCLPDNIATVLAQLCCHSKRLPQGAPTSPVVSNLVCRRLDLELSRFAAKLGCRYSRYADDITFSTRRPRFPTALVADHGEDGVTLGDEIESLIKEQGFEINEEKTRLMGRSVRQEVSGIKVNEFPNVNWNYIRQLRALLHSWRTRGYSAANQFFRSHYAAKDKQTVPSLKKHLEGKIGFLIMVRGQGDLLAARYAIEHARLAGKTYTFDGSASKQAKILAEAVWVVAGLDSTGDALVNGTACYLSEIGFVTSRHVFDVATLHGLENVISEWVLINPARPTQKWPFTVRRACKALDLAILETERHPQVALSPSARTLPDQNEPVLVAGYPNWLKGNLIRVESGAYTHSIFDGTRRLVQSSCSVYGGNSGGAMLDNSGQVVAVMCYGAMGAALPHSGVHVEHVLELAKRDRISSLSTALP